MTTSTATTVAKAMKAAGFSADEIARVLTGASPAAASPAAAPTSSPKAKPNTFHRDVIAKRVPCSYGVRSCGAFAPNGVGSKQHTTCPKGRAALKAARK
jgi:hypothetical protein